MSNTNATMVIKKTLDILGGGQHLVDLIWNGKLSKGRSVCHLDGGPQDILWGSKPDLTSFKNLLKEGNSFPDGVKKTVWMH